MVQSAANQPGAVGGCPYFAMKSEHDVSGLRELAKQNLADPRTIAVLEEAFRLDPADPKGETSALLGTVYFNTEQYGLAVRHLEAAVAKQPDNADLKYLLERASRNCETKIERPMMPVTFYDGAEIKRPPAMGLQEPKVAAPLPYTRDAAAIGMAKGAYKEVSGSVFGAILGAGLKVIKKMGLYDGKRDVWPKRGAFFGRVTVGAVREEMNEKMIQDPYKPGELTAHQKPMQKRPQWTESMPTADGSWRTDDPREGARGARFGHQGMQDFELFKNRAEDPTLPSAREVSRLLGHLKEGKEQVLAPFLNLFYAANIQANSHDWFSHGENLTNQFYEVPLAPDDPWRKQGLTHMKVRKSQNDPNPTVGRDTTVNEVTHWWDASQIYGSDTETENRVRTGPDGKILPGGQMYLVDKDGKPDPKGFLPVNPTTGISDSGFTRNWWVGLEAFHTLFARHHNYVCEQLQKEYPDHPWTSDQLFKTARLIVAALIAKIHTREWTPAVLPNKSVAPGLDYNWSGGIEVLTKPFDARTATNPLEPNNPILGGLVGGKRNNHGKRYMFPEVFAGAAYRLHSALTENVEIRHVGDDKPRAVVSTDKTRGDMSRKLMVEHGLGNILNSFMHQKGGALINNNNPRWATDMSVDGAPSVDIFAVDVLRDRERGIPPYNIFRQLEGYPPLTSYDDLGCDAETKAALEKLYGPAPEGLDKMDTLVGMLCDQVRPEGFAFDDVRFKVFIHAASSRLEQDPFFTEKFTPEFYTQWGIDHINANSMKTIAATHCPELEPVLRNVNNFFEPVGTTAETHPEEHPLTSKGIERYE